ncbi:hypothetical protein M1328_03070 [Patescibacteria group bacterium]|nr:hypothetical protein [Patescibacteria group bacterium]
MKKGKLIVVEGIDGSGKETQANLLIDYLKSNKISTSLFDFPQYHKTFFGDFIGRFLNGEFGNISNINPYLAAFPYAGDRWQAKELIEDSLKKNAITVCNRYTPSVAYQMAKLTNDGKQHFLNWTEKLEYGIFKIPKEDLVIFLNVPYKFAFKLIEGKAKRNYLKGKLKDQYEENVSYLKEVEKIYGWLNKRKNNWVKIDCLEKGKILNRQQIHLKIVASLKKRAFI